MFKTAIGIAKDAKDLLLDSAQKTTLTSSLSAAERTTAIAEAQIAKGLGYHLCQRNLSMTLRHLVSEFSVAPHRSVPPASVD
jgi:hypothetical protein